MPRKHKTSASSIQNRDNQRRSRARHREFVEDLRRRLQEYERRGFEATLEMQQAARAIALENERLRELLARHGVPRDEVNAYLLASGSVGAGESQNHSASQLGAYSRVFKADEAAPNLYGAAPDKVIDQVQEKQTLKYRTVEAPPLSPPPSLSGQSHFTGECSRFERGASGDDDANSIANYFTSETQSQPDPEVNELPNGNRRDCVRISYICSGIPDQDHPRDILPHVSDCYCPPESPVPDLNSAQTLETSCETAASIIAEVQGYDDSAQVRAALGCVGTGDCRVRNTKLFQVMDETS
ncbi:hypothetical protein NKR23_g12204 [Pleurostoma richardsiae]|uniref:BZIP domain-containing protein n=1 Tax=Pleurostoma richardsiae TaxID=41990 RepID=A0AA38R2J7_9PEZI|nr:hypothetical protein NKR23_g12204 [Pleurostoma richardsiae]